MDPLSIATACVSLATGITNLSMQISSFVASVRDARADMVAVSAELTSLSICVQSLKQDSSSSRYPPGVYETLVSVLNGCNGVTREMTALLVKLSSTNLVRKIQWALTGQSEMNQLRSSLETHKTALNIALGFSSLTAVSAVKDDTQALRSFAEAQEAHIRELLRVVDQLRSQLSGRPILDGKNMILQRFLEETESYAETVVDDLDDGDVEFVDHCSNNQFLKPQSSHSRTENAPQALPSYRSQSMGQGTISSPNNDGNMPLRAVSGPVTPSRESVHEHGQTLQQPTSRALQNANTSRQTVSQNVYHNTYTEPTGISILPPYTQIDLGVYALSQNLSWPQKSTGTTSAIYSAPQTYQNNSALYTPQGFSSSTRVAQDSSGFYTPRPNAFSYLNAGQNTSTFYTPPPNLSTYLNDQNRSGSYTSPPNLSSSLSYAQETSGMYVPPPIFSTFDSGYQSRWAPPTQIPAATSPYHSSDLGKAQYVGPPPRSPSFQGPSTKPKIKSQNQYTPSKSGDGSSAVKRLRELFKQRKAEREVFPKEYPVAYSS